MRDDILHVNMLRYPYKSYIICMFVAKLSTINILDLIFYRTSFPRFPLVTPLGALQIIANHRFDFTITTTNSTYLNVT